MQTASMPGCVATSRRIAPSTDRAASFASASAAATEPFGSQPRPSRTSRCSAGAMIRSFFLSLKKSAPGPEYGTLALNSSRSPCAYPSHAAAVAASLPARALR